MALRVWEDNESIGYARIDLGRRVPTPVRLSFQRVEDEPRHLGKEGWQPEIAWLEVHEVETNGETSIARVGPIVVSRISEFERIEIVADGIGELGTVSWPEMARPAVDLVYGRDLWSARPGITGRAGGPPPPPPPPTPLPTPPIQQAYPLVAPPPALGTGEAPAPKVRSRLPVWLGFAVVAVACGLAAVQFNGTADLCGMVGIAGCPRGGTHVTQAPSPAPTPPFSEVDAKGQLNALINGSATDAQFVEMGRKALAAGYPVIALRAFEQVVDPKQNEEAAFQIARIFDPLVTDSVYASVHNRRPERASPYYSYCKRTSSRCAEALNRLCDANPDLKRTNAKFADECRN
ncbi:hypothetical protein [Methylorubrum extorquens]|uniref:Uncharacterized protein n=1 Tax=Methylorubrum extorquens (strain CM4 / NCIMB 13688) TaxID=440085 RepID=B7KW00_METC4|nr:hypothetical protein [Methylorubrum extorquens]ACK82816.1 hypothetical protein Mchl_1962 [Methylorubrum extorquens CM4]